MEVKDKIAFKDRYYIALGKIVTHLNVAQQWLIHDISLMLGVEEDYCVAMLARNNFYSLLDIAQVIHSLRENDESQRDKFQKMVSDLHTARKGRNDYIHGFWGFADSIQYAQMVRYSTKNGKLDVNITQPETEELERLSKDIANRFRKLHSFIMENFNKKK